MKQQMEQETTYNDAAFEAEVRAFVEGETQTTLEHPEMERGVPESRFLSNLVGYVPPQGAWRQFFELDEIPEGPEFDEERKLHAKRHEIMQAIDEIAKEKGFDFSAAPAKPKSNHELYAMYPEQMKEIYIELRKRGFSREDLKI